MYLADVEGLQGCFTHFAMEKIPTSNSNKASQIRPFVLEIVLISLPLSDV